MNEYQELLRAAKALREFMWSEGYADQTPEMAQADAAIKACEALIGEDVNVYANSIFYRYLGHVRRL